MKSVLIVEDDASIRELLKYLLVKRGLRVHEARDGLEALKLIVNNEYDILLTDIEMPRMTGIELVQTIRHCLGPKTIYMMSGDINFDEKDAISLQTSGFFQKPFLDLEQMINVILA